MEMKTVPKYRITIGLRGRGEEGKIALGRKEVHVGD